jgi:hypothetical protein
VIVRSAGCEREPDMPLARVSWEWPLLARYSVAVIRPLRQITRAKLPRVAFGGSEKSRAAPPSEVACS